MANYKNNKKTNVSNGKIAKAVGAVLMAGVLLGGGIAIGWGDATDWSYKKSSVIEQVQPGTSDDEGNMAGTDIVVADEDPASPMKLIVKKMAAPAGVAEEHMSYQVTAELTPSDSTDLVDMSIAWASENSENISEYLQLDHADGAKTATVTALKPYSTTINLTATVRGRDISKSIKLDYLKKIKDTNFTSDGGNFGDAAYVGFSADCFDKGSIYPSKVVVEVESKLKLASALTQKGFKVKSKKNQITFDNETDWTTVQKNMLYTFGLSLFNDGNNETDFSAEIYRLYDSLDEDLIIVEYTTIYYVICQGDEVLVSADSSKTDFYLAKSNFTIPASDMNFGTGNCVFF